MGFAMPDEESLAPRKPIDFLDAVGTYHFAINHFDPNPTRRDGSMMDSVKAEMFVLDGTDPSQKSKVFYLFLNNPNLSHGDNGAFCWTRQVRFAMAVGIPAKRADGSEIPFDKVPKGEEVDIDWKKHNPKGKSIIARINHPWDKEKKEPIKDKFDIDGMAMYRLDDPDVLNIPKNATALKAAGLDPAKYGGVSKPSGAANQQQQKPANGNNNGGASQQQQKSEPAAAAAGPNVDDLLDDLN